MSRLTEINKDACDLCNLDCKHMDNSCEKAKLYNKLAHYEELEDELKRLYNGMMSIDKLVDNFNKVVYNVDERLDYARILTNEDAEKWVKWKELEEQGRLIELPCKVGDKVYCLNYTRWKEDGKYKYKEFWVRESFLRLEHIPYFGKTVFLTKAEAEARLAELKEGGSDE